MSYTLYPIPYTIFHIPSTLYPILYTLHPTPTTLYPIPNTIHIPKTLYPIPGSLAITLYSILYLNPNPYTLNLWPNFETLDSKYSRCCLTIATLSRAQWTWAWSHASVSGPPGMHAPPPTL